MGDGQKLKQLIEQRNTNVRQVAKATGISATTLYTIIQKDSNIRLDFALKLANELEIDVNDICSLVPFSGELKEDEIYPELPSNLKGALDSSRVKQYLKYSLFPLLHLYGKDSMPDLDKLLISFDQLDDEARREIMDTVQLKLQYHKDKNRAKDVNKIKGW